MSEKKPICGILAGEPEIIGERCADGGKCHHRCTDTCSRRATCAPLSGSGLLPDWSTGEPSLSAFRDVAGDRFEVPVAGWEAPAQDEREAIEVVAYLIRHKDDHNMRGVRLHVDRSCYDARTETLDLMTVAQHERIVAALTRPAQTEQQPVAYAVFAENGNVICFSIWREHPSLVALERNGHSVVTLAPIAQTAPQPEQSGFVLMPKEATPEIVAAMKNALDKSPAWYCRYKAAYRAALSAQGQSNGCSALADVAAERRRQIEAEGWVPEHDDEHSNGEMALAAACYARAGSGVPMIADVPLLWPWTSSWWKPAGARRNLVKAAALILAEIERLDRAAARAGGDA